MIVVIVQPKLVVYVDWGVRNVRSVHISMVVSLTSFSCQGVGRLILYPAFWSVT